MNIIETRLPGVLLITPTVFDDPRGFFLELHNANAYQQLGLSAQFVQDNVSCSGKGVLRGLHYQIKQPQGKLVSVLAGSVYDVAVDVRPDSPYFGAWVGVELTAKNHQQLYIPPGFAHGFCVLSDQAIFHYKCTDYYAADDEGGIIWNDPDLAIEWPELDQPWILSQKDRVYPTLAERKACELPSILNQKAII